jgi:hypothetical protein
MAMVTAIACAYLEAAVVLTFSSRIAPSNIFFPSY